MTYEDILTASRIDLRDKESANLDDTDLLKLAVDGVHIFREIIANANPEMIWSKYTISILSATGYGPYSLPTDFKTPELIQDDQNEAQEVDKISRPDSRHMYLNGRPEGYWLEGYKPTQIYFDTTPTEDHDFTLWYIAHAARATDKTDTVPLPDFYFVALNTWTTKMAGVIDEYSTMDEDAKIMLANELLTGVLAGRSGALEVEVEGLGF